MFNGCQNEPILTSEPGSGDSSADARAAATATFGYFVFSDAIADNGHTIYVQTDNAVTFPDPDGNTLSVHPKSAQGGGIFFHSDENGDPVASGTWTATDLLSFKDYGPAGDPNFPFSDGRAGFANLRVHLVSDAGDEFDAILRIQCLLPGNDSTPPSWVEGIRISVNDGLNFNKTVGGATLFIDLN